MAGKLILNEDEIAALYYYHVDSSIKYTTAMDEAYKGLVHRIKNYRQAKNNPPEKNAIWEALKGVVG